MKKFLSISYQYLIIILSLNCYSQNGIQFNPPAWLLNGNSNGTLKYIGTNDNNDFPIYTNSIQCAVFKNNQTLGIRTNTPNGTLNINGGVSDFNTSPYCRFNVGTSFASTSAGGWSAVISSDNGNGDGLVIAPHNSDLSNSNNWKSQLVINDNAGNLIMKDMSGTTVFNFSAQSGFNSFMCLDIGQYLTIGGTSINGKLGIKGETSDNTQNTFLAVNSLNANLFYIRNDGLTYINGALQYIDGNQAANKVLTSDASGNATWQALPYSNLTTLNSKIALTSSVTLTTATAANITSISLNAGTWLLSGNVNFNEVTATVTARRAQINSTSATFNSDGTSTYSDSNTTLMSGKYTLTLPSTVFVLSSTTTIYLIGQETFSAGTCAGFGSITAIRIQ